MKKILSLFTSFSTGGTLTLGIYGGLFLLIGGIITSLGLAVNYYRNENKMLELKILSITSYREKIEDDLKKDQNRLHKKISAIEEKSTKALERAKIFLDREIEERQEMENNYLKAENKLCEEQVKYSIQFRNDSKKIN